MNTFMWDHPITSVQVKQLIHMGYTHIPPIKKTLACGDTGNILLNVSMFMPMTVSQTLAWEIK